MSKVGVKEIKPIDHIPTVSDFTGTNTLLIQYNKSSLLVWNKKGVVYQAVDLYVELPTTTKFSIEPENPTVMQGQSLQFAVDDEELSVTWSIMGNTDSSTGIDVNGLLTVGGNETIGENALVVVATVDTNTFAFSFVTVEEPISQGFWLYREGVEFNGESNLTYTDIIDTRRSTPTHLIFGTDSVVKNINSGIIYDSACRLYTHRLFDIAQYYDDSDSSNIKYPNITVEYSCTNNGDPRYPSVGIVVSQNAQQSSMPQAFNFNITAADRGNHLTRTFQMGWISSYVNGVYLGIYAGLNNRVTVDETITIHSIFIS